MNRFKNCFTTPTKKLALYFTAGFPNHTDTIRIAEECESSGCDIIEIGMPFSDPLADGPVIQQSSEKALEQGMTIKVLFQQLTDLRKKVNIPVVLMGYLNPVMQYGKEAFLKECKAVGVDGLILPDLPTHEFEANWKPQMDELGLSMTFLVTPETSEERVKMLDKLSSGFLYLVSSSSTTGGEGKSSFSEDYIKRIASYKLNNPLLVGFGIKDNESFNAASQHVNGAIVGSAFIKQLEKDATSQGIKNFVNHIKN